MIKNKQITNDKPKPNDDDEIFKCKLMECKYCTKYTCQFLTCKHEHIINDHIMPALLYQPGSIEALNAQQSFEEKAKK